jgi:hypothetical protein
MNTGAVSVVHAVAGHGHIAHPPGFGERQQAPCGIAGRSAGTSPCGTSFIDPRPDDGLPLGGVELQQTGWTLLRRAARSRTAARGGCRRA